MTPQILYFFCQKVEKRKKKVENVQKSEKFFEKVHFSKKSSKSAGSFWCGDFTVTNLQYDVSHQDLPLMAKSAGPSLEPAIRFN